MGFLSPRSPRYNVYFSRHIPQMENLQQAEIMSCGPALSEPYIGGLVAFENIDET